MNNVGVANTTEFVDADPLSIHNLVSVNSYPTVLLTKVILASFEKRWKQKQVRSLLVNASAMASHGAAKILNVYCSSKLFTDFISQGLQFELSSIGTDVCAFRPAGVRTNMVAGLIADDDVASVSADELVEAVFSKCTSGVHHGHFKHEIIGLLIDSIQDIVPWFGDFAIGKVAAEIARKKLKSN